MTEARVFLVGMMGAGKTTTGRLLATRLGWAYHDTDDCIEATAGMSIPELFLARGEGAFREEETKALASFAGRPSATYPGAAGPAVVSVGGGSVLAEANRALLGSGVVVWLRANASTLLARLGGGTGRPMLRDDPTALVPRLVAEREPAYRSVADVVVDVDGRGADEVAALVADALAGVLPSSAEPPSSEVSRA